MPGDGEADAGTGVDGASTDASGGGAEAADADASGGGVDGDAGRYCYCLVRVGEDTDPELDAVGVEEAPVHVVSEGDVGAVVHPRTEPYDSQDPIEVRRWLLAHQRVVDAAADAFGTPLPFRFDTIVAGDDGAVRAWLREEYDAVDDALSDLAGHWEYRVSVLADPDAVERRLLDRDADLRDLREAVETDEGGTGFLREKQFEQRLSEARREWHAEMTDRVLAAAEGVVREARQADHRSGSASGSGNAAGAGAATGPAHDATGGGRTDERDGDADDDGDSDTELVTSVTVLATAEGADRFGDRLDDVAAEPGIEVRYTGPWAPYSFAPSFGEGR